MIYKFFIYQSLSSLLPSSLPFVVRLLREPEVRFEDALRKWDLLVVRLRCGAGGRQGSPDHQLDNYADIVQTTISTSLSIIT